ncbi:MAG: M56 family metallopeptidase [Oscillospiraceae bacterium]|jgi:beta-lactamase regulating signal transducer with metallopeptidase domain|nr:M56 family metallopeptidase [Oscillospiraceae bacterium]
MREVLLTSSALILALLVLRQVFRKRISRRVQYALWGLVLVRLLVPANLPAADFSVLSVSEPARVQMEERLEEEPVYVLPVSTQEIARSSARPNVILPMEGRYSEVTQAEGQPAVLTKYAFTLEEALGLVWAAGMGCMGLWLAVSNLRFWHMLRKKRIPMELPECRYPVYLVEEGLVSPCLFGLFRPAVYLTPAAMESGEGLRHVLAHEETHGRHGDPLWSLLRSVCLAVYWFDPLVWWAAAAAREDCELACDESALRRLGEAERIPYGQTLLRLIPLQRSAGHVMLTATTMTSDKKRMKERIMRISENLKMKTAALCAALAVTAAVCAVTFTGCSTQAAAGTASPENLNAPSDRQSPQPVGPEGRPVDMLTIPLTDALSYELEKVETYSANDLIPGHHSGEHEDRRQGRHHTGGGCRTTENCGTFAWSYDGNTYVSSHDLSLSSFPDDYFLCIPEQTYREEAFTNILGYSGVMIDYNARDPETDYYGSFCDYYVFEEGASGTDVYLLARVCGVPEVVDLDGDGTMELIGSDCNGMAQIFFKRDGKLHEANIGSLLSEYWTEASSVQFLGWYTADRYLKVYAGVPVVKDGQVTDVLATAYREIYFNGQSLQMAKGQREMVNHLLAGVQDMSVVVDAARTAAEANARAWTDNYGKGMEAPPEWDDYCVTALDLVYPVEFAAGQPENGMGIAVYEFRYDVHTTTPERVTPLPGGAYLDEDGWVGGFYDPNGSYLVFQILDDGSYKQLDGTISHDLGPETSEFMADLERVLSDNGLTSAWPF